MEVGVPTSMLSKGQLYIYVCVKKKEIPCLFIGIPLWLECLVICEPLALLPMTHKFQLEIASL